MCYSNCPGENWQGECVKPSLQNTLEAHCYDGDKEESDGTTEEKEEAGAECLPEM